MNEKHFEQWSKIRKKGMFFYVGVFGVLGIGVPAFVGMAVLFNKHNEAAVSHNRIAITCFVVGCGMIIGFYNWFFNESRYKKYIEANTKNSE